MELLPHYEKWSHLSFTPYVRQEPWFFLMCFLEVSRSFSAFWSSGYFTPSAGTFSCRGYLSVAASTVTYTLWLLLHKSLQEESCSQVRVWFTYIASGVSSSCSNIHAEDLHVELKLKQKRGSINSSDICLSVVPCLEPEAKSWGTAVLAERDLVLRGERLHPSSGTVPISNYAQDNKSTFYFLFSFFLTSACNH